ncbi:hypothetical protein TcG_09125 [Trypanosoma cruzi]|nr:hypothetical protein TcG_09125 [Trypanosoma cruzi]
MYPSAVQRSASRARRHKGNCFWEYLHPGYGKFTITLCTQVLNRCRGTTANRQRRIRDKKENARTLPATATKSDELIDAGLPCGDHISSTTKDEKEEKGRWWRKKSRLVMVNRGRRSKRPLCANCGKATRLRLRVKMCRPRYLKPAVKNTRLTSKKKTLLARQQWV